MKKKCSCCGKKKKVVRFDGKVWCKSCVWHELKERSAAEVRADAVEELNAPDTMENRTAAEELQEIKDAVKGLATKQNLIKAGTCAVGVFVVGMIAVHFGADQMVYRWLNPWAPF
ncbi:hypothetical protein [uncultured Megasphaera sp.]|uniref:hypothetical protein n=1 Tax=Megasphaera massiliensis TaxID=1232428 RepID=UPI00266CE976|nr:hypothetical protein [uncultured Megasphaera sp.]